MISKRPAFKHWKQISPLYIHPHMMGEIVQLALTGQNTNLTSTTLDTPQESSLRRITAMAIVTTADGASSVVPSLTIGWTDADSGVAQTLVLLATQAGNTTGTKLSGTALINAKSNVAITAAGASYASGTTGAMKYSLYITVEAL